VSSEVTGAGRGAAVDRVTRTMSLALGVGAAIFALLALQGFVAQYGASAPLWSWGVATCVFVVPIVNGVLSRFAPVRVLRLLAGVCATGHLLGLLTMVPALDGGILDSDLGASWLFGVSVIATASAAVAWRPAITWPYVAACVLALGVDRYLASSFPIPDLAVQDALHTLLFDAIFTALALATYRAGRALDSAADTAIAETRAAATTEAQGRERTRVEALMHDSVLVALLASARGSPRAAIEARAALAELDAVEDAVDDAQLGAIDWMWRLQALTTDLAPDARFSHECSDHEASIRSDAAQAILEAAAEALRNSIQHAGPASRAVHAQVTDELVEVTVLDDGRGFDPADVRPGRLGVAVSIRDRMHAVPGGWAAVVSRRGEGTRVAIGWRVAT
jgi:signal transduction histidine kinase